MAILYDRRQNKPHYSIQPIQTGVRTTRYVVCAEVKGNVLYACNERPTPADWVPSMIAAKKFETRRQAQRVIDMCEM